MAEPKRLKVSSLPLDSIAPREGDMRPVQEARVEAILASMAENGGILIDPITVRRKKDGTNVLVAGAHRLEAVRRLKWCEVPVSVWTNITNDDALVIELDGNLAGGTMSSLDMAVYLAQRKKVHEKQHPETRRGHAGAAARHANGLNPVATFVTVAAQASSSSSSKIDKLIRVGSALSDDQVHLLRSAPKSIGFNDLVALSKITEPSERTQVCVALSNGHANNVSEARAAYAAECGRAPAPLSARDQAYLRLMDAFQRAPKSAKRAFVEENQDQLQQLLNDLEGDA